jgi:hypothetical protein
LREAEWAVRPSDKSAASLFSSTKTWVWAFPLVSCPVRFVDGQCSLLARVTNFHTQHKSQGPYPVIPTKLKILKIPIATMKVLDRAAADGEGESSSNSADNTSTSLIGWLALGLRTTFGGGYNEDKADEDRPSPAAAMSNEFSSINHEERGKHKELVAAAAACRLDVKVHAKTSPFDGEHATARTAAKEIEKGETRAKSIKETTHSVATVQPRTLRHPVIKRQPTGDEDDFNDTVSEKNGEDEAGSSMKRRGQKTSAAGPAEADEDQSNPEDSVSNDGGTSRSDRSDDSKKESRCKPLLERKATGDEDDWDKVVPAASRRARRKAPSQDDTDKDGESESTEQIGESGQTVRRSRPVVARQPTGDAETFAVQKSSRAPRRGGRKAAASSPTNGDGADGDKQQGLSPTTRVRKLINRTPTGDFSEDDPNSSQPNSSEEQPLRGKRASRPIVRRQATGDKADFAALATSAPRRGRRNVAVDASESSQSQGVDDSTNGSEQGPTRRSRPVVRRQPTGDQCDFNAPQAPRQKQRRPRIVDDQSNSQSASDMQDPSCGESDNPYSNSTTLEEACGETNPVEIDGHRSRPTVRRQGTGDMTDFDVGSTTPTVPSSSRKGRRRNRDNSESQSSTTSTAVRITRAGLARRVTGEGSFLAPRPLNSHLPPAPAQGPDTSLVAAWVASPVAAGFDESQLAAGSDKSPLVAGSEDSPRVAESDEIIQISCYTIETEASVTAVMTAKTEEAGGASVHIDLLPKNPRRGVRRNPTGDFDAFFLKESPLNSIADDLPKPPQRCVSNSQDSPLCPPPELKRTPTGDEEDFAMLHDFESDDESGGGLVDSSPDADMKPAPAKRTLSSGATAQDRGGTVEKRTSESPDSPPFPPSRLKRTPTGDVADFDMLPDAESDDDSGGSLVDAEPAADTKTRGVHRTPTGDEADFAMLLDSELDGGESSKSSDVDASPNTDSTGSSARDERAGSVEKRRGVQRMPTGDEADFAMLLDSELDGGSSSQNNTMDAIREATDATPAPNGRVSQIRRIPSTRFVHRMPTGDEANFAMDNEVESGESNGNTEKTRGVHRVPTGDEADFAMLLGMDVDGGESSGSTASGADAVTHREAGTTTVAAAAPNSRGVKRIPTGDSLDFATYIDVEHDDDDGDIDNSEDFTNDLEEVKRNVRVAAAVATNGTTSGRRSAQRTPTGDEADFGLMLCMTNEEG